MAFDNKSITPVHPDKPHIVFRDGWWRVSTLAPHIGAREKYNKAHQFVMELNYNLRDAEAVHKAHIQRLLKIFGGKFLKVKL